MLEGERGNPSSIQIVRILVTTLHISPWVLVITSPLVLGGILLSISRSIRNGILNHASFIMMDNKLRIEAKMD